MCVVYMLCCVVIVRGANPRCGIGWITEMETVLFVGFDV